MIIHMIRLRLTISAVMCLTSCGPPGSATSPTTQPLSFKWDLSIDNRIERVGWPSQVTDHIWLIDGPGAVRLKVRGGVEHDVAFSAAQVWREGSRIKTIALIGHIGTVDEVYADAMKLASDWRITDVSDIEVFKNTKAYKMEHGGSGVYGVRAGGDGLEQGRSIEIRQSFNSASGEPYVAIMAFGFVPDYDGPPATGPTDSGAGH